MFGWLLCISILAGCYHFSILHDCNKCMEWVWGVLVIVGGWKVLSLLDFAWL
jgi:hypothetical protein